MMVNGVEMRRVFFKKSFKSLFRNSMYWLFFWGSSLCIWFYILHFCFYIGFVLKFVVSWYHFLLYFVCRLLYLDFLQIVPFLCIIICRYVFHTFFSYVVRQIWLTLCQTCLPNTVFPRTNSLLEKVCEGVGASQFYGCLWDCLASNAAVRLPAISFVLAHYDRRLSTEDQLHIMGTNIDIMVYTIIKLNNY